MAKARIVYVVDDRELKQVEKDLKDIQKGNKKVEESFKGTNEEIKKSKTSVVDLKGAVANIGFSALVGAAIISFGKLTQEINKNRKEVALLTKETGKSLDLITAKVRATSKVFDKEFTEVLRAANAVSKNLGITMTETMDQINDAMSRGLDINGEYLETISEYSPFMKQAGIDFQQFNVLIQKQLTDGVFSDKGIDAIKEAVISIQEMTPATRDALRAVGLNTNQIIKDIESGAKTYFDVIQDIGRSLEDVTDQTVRGQVLADIFRGAGEDAGDFALTLHEVGIEYADLTEEQELYVKNQKALLTSSEDLSLELTKLVKNIGPLGTAWKTFLNEAGAGTLRFVNDLIKGFDNLDKATESYKQSVLTLNIDEQEEEWARLTKQLDEVKERLDPKSKKYVFGISPEEKTLAQKELDLLTAKIKVLDDITLERTNNAKKANEELIALIEKERLAREAAAKRESKEAAESKLKEDKKSTIIGAKSLSTLKKQLAREEEEELKILRDEFSQDASEKAIQDEIDLNNEIFDITKQALDDKNQLEKDKQKEAQEDRTELILTGFEVLSEIQSGFAQLKIDQINQEIQANEFARNRELELAEQTGASKDAINAKFDSSNARLREKQAKAEKEAAIFAIGVNTARGIVAALASVPPNVALSIGIGIIGATQAGLVLAKDPPKFKEGVLKFKGKGTRTSDSNLVQISDQETILSAQTSDDYYPAVKAIYNREISPDIMNNIAMHQDTQPRTIVYDYDKLAKAVMNQPQKSLIADENGLTGYFLRQGKSLEIKQAKYKM